MRLMDQRCSNHPAREAVARCPGCGGFFCRECAIEQEGRMLCAACAARAKQDAAAGSPSVPWIFAGGVGFLLAWAVFYYLGLFLARIPAAFFERL